MITFFAEEVNIDLDDQERWSNWLMHVASAEGATISYINYIFCTDEYLLDINRKHLNHDYYTDIITFPYKTGKHLESDIFVSIDRVKDNAQTYGVSFDQELLRVIVHGILHLVGYKDKTEEDEKTMRQKEDEWMAAFFKEG